MPSWTDAERKLAHEMFVNHNRPNGALLPDGFGFLSQAERVAWYTKARAELERMEEQNG